MPSYTKARKLATEFEKVYPEELPDRLVWWGKILGIDRPRFLQMIGLPPALAKVEKDTSWTELLKNHEFAESAWWVEGKLHHLLALFDYDWKSLAERLHQGADVGRKERTRVSRQRGKIVKLPYVPVENGAATMTNQLANGGPDSFQFLTSYLARERAS